MTYEKAHDYEDEPEYDHQLSPLRGGRYNQVFHGPPGTDVGDLHCDLEPFIMGETPITINHSGWQPSERHVRQLESGAHVRLTVWQHPIPPLAVSIEPPVCRCHNETMSWDDEDCGFYCNRLGNPPTSPRTMLDEVHDTFTPGPEE